MEEVIHEEDMEEDIHEEDMEEDIHVWSQKGGQAKNIS